MLSLIPISDANPTRRVPLVTVGLIVLNVVMYIFYQPGTPSLASTPPADQVFFFRHAPLPCQLDDSCPPTFPGTGIPVPRRNTAEFVWSLVLSTFLHANILHLGGNMLFLWVFGNNVEDFLRPVKFTLFYLLGGIAAGMTQVLANPGSPVPAVGASGAVAGVLGAYFVLYPWARVNVLVPIVFIWTVIQMSAWVVLGLWFLYQFVVPQPGVAWQAHAGGFVYGVVMILLLGGRPHRPRPVWSPEWRY